MDGSMLGTMILAGRRRRVETDFSGLILCDLVLGVLLALLALAVGASSLWNVDL